MAFDRLKYYSIRRMMLLLSTWVKRVMHHFIQEHCQVGNYFQCLSFAQFLVKISFVIGYKPFCFININQMKKIA